MSKKFTELFPEDLTYNVGSRIGKAKKIQAILQNFFGVTKRMTCLDLGCSRGIITQYLGQFYSKTVGVDVDNLALKYARDHNKSKTISFTLSKENKIPFSNNCFDVVVFNQIYEHVENPERIFREIRRVLRKNGICFFGARNKFGIFDGHYSLPFLSWLPKSLADYYIRKTTDKEKYDIKLYSYWQLKKLTNNFKCIDYTLEVIKNPKKYNAQDVIPTNKFINKLIYQFSKMFYVFIPNYLWVLQKI